MGRLRTFRFRQSVLKSRSKSKPNNYELNIRERGVLARKGRRWCPSRKFAQSPRYFGLAEVGSAEDRARL